MNKKYQKILKAGKRTIKEAGGLLKNNFYKLRKIEKINGHDLHLKNDYQSEDLIKKSLKSKFPEIGFFGEERGKTDGKKDSYWVVDPLDGTVNYYFYNPFFAISIALVENKEIVLGLIYSPMTEEMFWAVKNEGAYYQEKKVYNKDSQYSKLVFGGYDNIKRCEHTKKYSLPGNRILNKIEMGCASLELAYVGTGRITSYLLEKVRLWDVAAGVLFIKEAGGQVTNWEGKDWTLDDEYLLASNNDKIHNNIIKKIFLSRDRTVADSF